MKLNTLQGIIMVDVINLTKYSTYTAELANTKIIIILLKREKKLTPRQTEDKMPREKHII